MVGPRAAKAYEKGPQPKLGALSFQSSGSESSLTEAGGPDLVPGD